MSTFHEFEPLTTLISRKFYFAADLGRGSQSSGYPASALRWPVSTRDAANLISSRLDLSADVHAPALDIDHPVSIRESETPGHYHLFIDVPMSWENYVKLLLVLVEVGIIERGYADASIERGATYVATRPWKQAS